ncbi:AbrB family looped-hinge helix DNA binding protein [Natronobacillus azotifigens]|uniref:AbrB/MazE/SpoVT family DNA-binding domain-containing protein n=1 Tax=Natronobacillus azotifigens TaxID=472978 RepID=A0A9J6RCH0_9BACI|nr:AbrB/MazE/SpoVT family DNA-binding domain-containing protein [Natronobacillus azotifigens]MCZ0702905.1 AbrB/MazE/SpoVT family DNA-binding domain-containing protein [Natronobacillus azotifigens]
MKGKAKREDKYMGAVKVGSKGQIVIPKEVRDMFDINPGDTLMLLADAQKGIALERNGRF